MRGVFLRFVRGVLQSASDTSFQSQSGLKVCEVGIILQNASATTQSKSGLKVCVGGIAKYLSHKSESVWS